MKHPTGWLNLILFLFALSNVYCQTYKMEGIVKDIQTNQPIAGASVILKNVSRGTSANDQGVFKLDFNSFPVLLFIQCLGYQRDTVIIESEERYNSDYRNQNRVFFLKQNPIQISEVQVKARSILFEKEPYSIIDYKFTGNRIFALGFKNGNEFRKEVLLADLSGKIISNHVYKNLDSLFQDCQGNIFAFCSDSAYELELARKQITISNRYKRSLITDFIAPVCCITDSIIYLKKSSFNYQYDNYFAARDSQYVMLIYSTGSLMKERQAASLNKTWTQQGQVPVTLYPPEKCYGECLEEWLKSVYEPAYHSYFSSHFKLLTDFHPVFTKMISFGTNLWIFDREGATIFNLNQKGEIIGEVGMNNKLNGMHYQDIRLDKVTGKIYLEFPQGPFTHFIEINPATGQEIRRFMVSGFHHIEKCEFLNNRLYFLYQPDVGMRIKKLYSIWI